MALPFAHATLVGLLLERGGSLIKEDLEFGETHLNYQGIAVIVSADLLRPGQVQGSATFPFVTRLDRWLHRPGYHRAIMRMLLGNRVATNAFALLQNDTELVEPSVWRHAWGEGITVQASFSASELRGEVGALRLERFIKYAAQLQGRISQYGVKIEKKIELARKIAHICTLVLWGMNIPGALVVLRIWPENLASLMIVSMLIFMAAVAGARIWASLRMYKQLLDLPPTRR